MKNHPAEVRSPEALQEGEVESLGENSHHDTDNPSS